MPTEILQDFVVELEKDLGRIEGLLHTHLDITALERELIERVNALVASLVAALVGPLLKGLAFLASLKGLGGRLGLRFKEYRRVRVRLGNGQSIELCAPYFVKAQPKRGRKKRGPNGRGAHLGLEVLGVVERCSPRLLSEVVQTALLCPSLEVARQVLARRGLVLDIKTIRRLCERLGQQGLAARGPVCVAGNEVFTGQTVVIGIDGGRLRERRRKRGRKRAGQRRQGYHTDWKEPKLFTLYVLDAHGEVVKEFPPLQDATMGDHEVLFAILEQYLRALDLSGVGKIVFCGDGAPWIWNGVERLCARLGLDKRLIYQVLDYTHAKQNLQEIIDLVPNRAKARHGIEKRWKQLLWQGDLKGLYQAICETLTGKHKREQALKKWQSFFEPNAQRMRYEHFEAVKIPCGSGCVESAIRRVINLRLKAPGSFWTKPMAECFLFLRSQLLSGRWDIVLRNITRKTARLLEVQPHSQSPHPSCQMLNAA